MNPSDHALLEAVQRGDEASPLLADPAFVSAVADITQSIVSRWAATALHEKALREDLYHQHTALQSITQVLASRVASGQRAREVLRYEAEEEAEFDTDFNTSEVLGGLYEEAP